MGKKASLSDFVASRIAEAPASQHVSNPVSQPAGLVKKTYYLHPGQVKALKLLAAETGGNVSELVRGAVEVLLEARGMEET